MKTPITGALVVCVAAAGVAVGALALEPGDSPTPAAGRPPTTAPAETGGYGASDDAGAVAGGGTGAPAEAAAASLEISGFDFGAATVAPGGDVTVDNRDSATHTVTATGGEFDSGEVSGGDTGSFTAPDERGSYEFQCEIHPEMAGTLTVR
jgi:plastocyanin